MSEARILPSPEIWHRDDFAYLCMWRKLFRVAEIGVDRGEFASTFLSRWIGDEYWGIDSYAPYPEMPFDRHADYLMAVERIKLHANRAKLLKHGSIEASQFFAPGSLDFVYIDGAHDYAGVKADLEAWYPKLDRRGILAGHDFDDQPVHAGVKEAVVEFAEKLGQTIYLTAVEGYQKEVCPSWYLYVSSMPGSGWRRC